MPPVVGLRRRGETTTQAQELELGNVTDTAERQLRRGIRSTSQYLPPGTDAPQGTAVDVPRCRAGVRASRWRITAGLHRSNRLRAELGVLGLNASYTPRASATSPRVEATRTEPPAGSTVRAGNRYRIHLLRSRAGRGARPLWAHAGRSPGAAGRQQPASRRGGDPTAGHDPALDGRGLDRRRERRQRQNRDRWTTSPTRATSDHSPADHGPSIDGRRTYPAPGHPSSVEEVAEQFHCPLW